MALAMTNTDYEDHHNSNTELYILCLVILVNLLALSVIESEKVRHRVQRLVL